MQVIVKKWRTGFIFDVVSKRFICRKKAAEEIQREGAARTIRKKTSGQEKAQQCALSDNRFIWRVRTSPRITCYHVGIAWVNVK